MLFSGILWVVLFTDIFLKEGVKIKNLNSEESESSCFYKTDSIGNWIERVEKSTIFRITKRKIEYYN